ncbi:hypothetical protein [Agromyces bauzanensis]
MTGPSSLQRPEPVASYLAAVDARIPRWLHSRRAALGELADGLDDAVRDYRTQGLTTHEAALRAVSESGPPAMIADAFTATLSAGHARHTALALLASGPIIGAVRLAALVPGRPPTTLLAQVPALGPVIFASIVSCGLTLLVTGPAKLRPTWARLRPPRLAAFGCACAAAGDVLMLGTAISVVVAVPGELAGHPLIGALALSVARLAIVQRAARRGLIAAPLRR